MPKQLRIWAWPLVLAVLFIACTEDGSDGDDDDNGASGHPPTAMLGRWDFASVTVDGNPATLSTTLDWDEDAVGADVQIDANGTYAYQEVDLNGGQLWSESGFIFVDGNELDINMLHNSDGVQDETTRHLWTLDGNTFTLQEEGTTTIVTLTRAAP